MWSDVQFGKVALGRETLDRLDQVLVRVGVTGDDFAHERDELERVLPVYPGNDIVVSECDLVSLDTRRGHTLGTRGW